MELVAVDVCKPCAGTRLGCRAIFEGVTPLASAAGTGRGLLRLSRQSCKKSRRALFRGSSACQLWRSRQRLVRLTWPGRLPARLPYLHLPTRLCPQLVAPRCKV